MNEKQNTFNMLNPPEKCDNCGSTEVVLLKINTKTSSFNRYACKNCGASVGCHENTNNPLGKMATCKTRQLRAKAHLEFDRLWKEHLMSRDNAYLWLANKLNIEIENCHISWLNKNQLLKTIDICKNNFYKLKRKKEKQDKLKTKNERNKYAKIRYHVKKRTKQSKKY